MAQQPQPSPLATSTPFIHLSLAALLTAAITPCHHVHLLLLSPPTQLSHPISSQSCHHPPRARPTPAASASPDVASTPEIRVPSDQQPFTRSQTVTDVSPNFFFFSTARPSPYGCRSTSLHPCPRLSLLFTLVAPHQQPSAACRELPPSSDFYLLPTMCFLLPPLAGGHRRPPSSSSRPLSAPS